MNNIYDLVAVSQKLKISVRGLRGFIQRGELKARKRGRAYYVTEEELTRFMQPLEEPEPKEEPGKPGRGFLTVSEFSKKAELPETTIREWLRDGKLEGVKDKGRWLVDPAMVKWWKEIQAGMRPKKRG